MNENLTDVGQWRYGCHKEAQPEPRPRCERCGSELELIEVLSFGTNERSFVPGRPCACPGPRCVFCGRRLDADNCCPSLPAVECPVGGVLYPPTGADFY